MAILWELPVLLLPTGRSPQQVRLSRHLVACLSKLIAINPGRRLERNGAHAADRTPQKNVLSAADWPRKNIKSSTHQNYPGKRKRRAHICSENGPEEKARSVFFFQKLLLFRTMREEKKRGGANQMKTTIRGARMRLLAPFQGRPNKTPQSGHLGGQKS